MNGKTSGPATDIIGNQVRDPTENVLDLVNAAVDRLDDLRKSGEEHTEQLAKLREQHSVELRIAEAARIDAIRRVDTEAVSVAAQTASAAAVALQGQVANAAEAVRNTLEATRVATEQRLAAALNPITETIALLQANLYAQQGERQAASEDKETSRFSVGTAVAVIGMAISTFVAVIAVVIGLYLGLRKPSTPPVVGTAVACSAPGILPGQVCTTNAPR